MHFWNVRLPSVAVASSAVTAALASLALAGCGTFDDMGHRVSGVFTPYKVEVVQGNFISREQVEALKPGMSRHQVRDILGTPLVASVFHADRWDYVFTLKRQGVEPQSRKLAVFFKGDVMDRVQGDPMPSESEFVATLDKRRSGTIPPLEASEEQLRAFSGKPAGAASATPAPATAPAASYPPLEAPGR